MREFTRLGPTCCRVWPGGGAGIVFTCGIITCHPPWLFMPGIRRVSGFFVCRCHNRMIVTDYLKPSDTAVMRFVAKSFN